MRKSLELQISDVNRAIEAALACASNNVWAISIAIVDPGGQLLGFKRMDGAAAGTAQVAQEKARTAALFCVPTGILEDKIPTRIPMLNLPGATPLRGGLPLLEEDTLLGAVGISGAAPEQDEVVAQAAFDALRAANNPC